MKRLVLMAALVSVALAMSAPPVAAQQTAGNITGRITDQQGAALPGVTITARETATGFTRSVVTDGEGLYRLTALPVGNYDIVYELPGFARLERQGIVVSVSQTITLDLQLKLAAVTETVTVTGETPLIETSDSSVGGVVDPNNIDALPLNGRQFANLAMTVPGVGMGFHSDPTKSTQYSPQIAGGNGRNVNYQIDGGDNNDDTVGGLLQAFPLEAIQEFAVITQRYKAEFGRSNGGVMNIVTKSGTNLFKGSWFTDFRDDSLNARTETEILTDVPKQGYKRYQYGGSFGGPIQMDKAHFFAAFEQTRQDAMQSVTTFGLFPDQEGAFPIEYRETLVTSKVNVNINPQQYLSVRYGRNTNKQPYATSPFTPPSGWGFSNNRFNSINLNHNWVVGGNKLNEFIFQFATFRNHIASASMASTQDFPNGVWVGQNPNAPQTTEQRKWQFRDDFSWHVTGHGGLGHDFKTGVNFIYEPRLYVTFNTGKGDYAYSHLDNNVNGLIESVSLQGGDSSANIPTRQYGLYFQDDWRINDRLTLNLGVRYDLVTGFAIDQSKNPNFVKLQAAGLSGRLNGMQGFEDFGKSSREDYNNIQPRIGLAYDVGGNGKDVIRAGWGIYYDFGYTNSNILFAAINASGIGFGSVFSVSNTSGIRKDDGSYFHIGDPISSIASQNEITAPPMGGHSASPRILQPYTRQTSAGWSHQFNPSLAVDVDYVRLDGKDLGWRPRLNTRVGGPTGPRRLADLSLSPQDISIDISRAYSTYDGLNLGIRQRSERWQLNGWYSLSKSVGLGGAGIDELNRNNTQDATKPFADVQLGPASRTDARHRFTISGVFDVGAGLQVSPIFRFRSALPVEIVEGLDLNGDGRNNDIPARAYAYGGLDANGNPIVNDIGPCTTVNCGRGHSLSTFNLRVMLDVMKAFRVPGRVKLEAMFEIFNLFNALNPSGFVTSRMEETDAGPVPNPNFLRPSEYSGDFQNPEQRVAQFGFRFSF